MRSVKWLVGLGGSTVLALLGAINGCSSSSEHPPVLSGTSTDSGHPSSSSGGSSGGGSGGGPTCLAADGGCTDLQLCGAQVNVHDATGTRPAPQGGAISPGTYVLTSVDLYGSGIAWLQQTFRLTVVGGDGGVAEGGTEAAAAEGGGDDGSSPEAGSESGAAGPSFMWESILLTDSQPLSTTNGTLTVPSPNNIVVAFACGSAGPPFTAGYTATSTTLALMVDGTSPETLTFTKQ
jgi:hypothetical protein